MKSSHSFNWLGKKPSDRMAPPLKGSLPFVGHALDFWRRPVELLRRGYQDHGDVFRFVLAGKDVTALLGPKGHKSFLIELVEPAYRPNYSTFVVGPYQPAKIRYRRRKQPIIAVPESWGGKPVVAQA